MRIRLDASTICQLKCPACSTSRGKIRKGVVGRGHLKFDDVKNLLDKNPSVKSIELSNWGEIFLNPELTEIIKYAYEKKVRLKAANGVNFNFVKTPVLEALVKYQFAYLSISIDGASQETYSLYRIKGNFNKVMKNIRILNRFKEQYNSSLPKLAWQFIVFGHNEHELPQAREMAENMGMAFKPKLNHTPGFSPVNNKSFVSEESGFGAASRHDFRSQRKSEYSFPCGQLWDNVQINWDGKLLGCCVNKFGDFGNVFEDGLEETLQGEKLAYAREMIMGNKPPREDIPCSRCKTFYRMYPEHNREELETNAAYVRQS